MVFLREKCESHFIGSKYVMDLKAGGWVMLGRAVLGWPDDVKRLSDFHADSRLRANTGVDDLQGLGGHPKIAQALYEAEAFRVGDGAQWSHHQ